MITVNQLQSPGPATPGTHPDGITNYQPRNYMNYGYTKVSNHEAPQRPIEQEVHSHSSSLCSMLSTDTLQDPMFVTSDYLCPKPTQKFKEYFQQQQPFKEHFVEHAVPPSDGEDEGSQTPDRLVIDLPIDLPQQHNGCKSLNSISMPQRRGTMEDEPEVLLHGVPQSRQQNRKGLMSKVGLAIVALIEPNDQSDIHLCCTPHVEVSRGLRLRAQNYTP